MAETLLELGSPLSLTVEEDAGVVLPNSGDSSLCELTLVGRLLTHFQANFEALSRMFVNLLQLVRGVNIRRVAENHFCFVFNHVVDLRRTLALRPWTFDRNLLILQPLVPGDSPEGVALDWCPFFIRVYACPVWSIVAGKFLDWPLEIKILRITVDGGPPLSLFLYSDWGSFGVFW
ncbi:hypothetical protein Salat_0513700 [Sesamum alatum]|uniref:DUF4283 domain-containing protein n=1 Tax=Sesamum alatum TaxID=300844 RepID=A0AAE1Z5C3_9LAMI|nr:hypothetical protein Salat_0513700 [Sesamum alatum]